MPGPNGPEMIIKMSPILIILAYMYLAVKLGKWIEDKCPFFDNKFDSKYQICIVTVNDIMQYNLD